MFRIKQVGGKHATEVTDGRITVLFSYATPVAAHVEGRGYLKTEERHSVTTSRHINAFLGAARDRAEVMPQAWFDGIAVTVGARQ